MPARHNSVHSHLNMNLHLHLHLHLHMHMHMHAVSDEVGTVASHELAFEAALQGMVLLKNTDGALPLKRGPGIKTAVLGPLANITLGMMSRYYDAVCPGRLNPNIPWSRGMRPSQCIEVRVGE